MNGTSKKAGNRISVQLSNSGKKNETEKLNPEKWGTIQVGASEKPVAGAVGAVTATSHPPTSASPPPGSPPPSSQQFPNETSSRAVKKRNGGPSGRTGGLAGFLGN